MLTITQAMNQAEVTRAAQALKYGPQAKEPGYTRTELAGIDIVDFRRKWEQVTNTGKTLEELGIVQEDQR
jgi:hypothetical protein